MSARITGAISLVRRDLRPAERLSAGPHRAWIGSGTLALEGS
jgi:hypothetical protein